MKKDKHAHVYCKRYVTERFVVEYSGQLDVLGEGLDGLAEMTLVERQSCVFTLLNPQDSVVIALQEIDPYEIYVLKMPPEDARVVLYELQGLEASRVTFHYIERMTPNIIVTYVAPDSGWLVNTPVRDGCAPNKQTISFDAYSTLLGLYEVKDSVHTVANR